MPNFKLIELSQESKTEFINTVEINLRIKFGTDIPENYTRETPWSLLSLLENDAIDSYCMLYLNDEFWSAGGGIVREFNGDRVYQAGFRGFSAQTIRSDWAERGTGTKSYTWQYIIHRQINRAIELKCDKVIISFNDYNVKLFKISKFHLLHRC